MPERAISAAIELKSAGWFGTASDGKRVSSNVWQYARWGGYRTVRHLSHDHDGSSGNLL